MLSQLSEIDRGVLEMRHPKGCTIGDIAELLDLSQDMIKERYYRALSRFRQIVSQSTEFLDNDLEVT